MCNEQCRLCIWDTKRSRSWCVDQSNVFQAQFGSNGNGIHVHTPVGWPVHMIVLQRSKSCTCRQHLASIWAPLNFRTAHFRAYDRPFPNMANTLSHSLPLRKGVRTFWFWYMHSLQTLGILCRHTHFPLPITRSHLLLRKSDSDLFKKKWIFQFKVPEIPNEKLLLTCRHGWSWYCCNISIAEFNDRFQCTWVGQSQQPK